MIAPSVLDRAFEIRNEFQTALPFRHVCIDGFLEVEKCQTLLRDFPAFQEKYAINEMGAIGNKAVRADVSNLPDIYRALDERVKSPEFLRFVSAISGIDDLCYDPDYIGGGTHENRDGQGLDPHIDFNILPGRQWHRRLNLIIYLNPVWKESWGGCIELHSDPWSPRENQIRRILPSFNRCVLFETNENSWHGFETIRLPADQKGISRKSFAIYLYTQQRPEQESVASHATVYVPAGMPTDLQPGMPLTLERHADLTQRFDHMLGQLRFLYDRELEYSAQLEQFRQALAESAARLKFDLQGYAVQEDGARGLWADGWMGRVVRARFTPTVAAQALELCLRTPVGMSAPQELRVSLGDCHKTMVIAPGQQGEVLLETAMPAGRAVELQIDASTSWQPASSGGSGDERELAVIMVKAVLRH